MLHFTTDEDADALQTILRRFMKGVNTSIPGIINSFNKDNQTVRVKPAIRSIRTIDNEQQFTELPELIEVPVRSIYGKTSGFSLTFPINKGDECLLIFSQRSIDKWHDNGGVQNPVESTVPRSHDLSDGFALVGVSSKPCAITDYQDDCIEIRNSDRSVRTSVYDDRVEIQTAGGLLKVTDAGELSMTNSSGEYTDLVQEMLTLLVPSVIPANLVAYNAALAKFITFKE